MVRAYADGLELADLPDAARRRPAADGDREGGSKEQTRG
jgi:hypothetical protein